MRRKVVLKLGSNTLRTVDETFYSFWLAVPPTKQWDMDGLANQAWAIRRSICIMPQTARLAAAIAND